ncbi:MAG TPA: PPC domain-containing protein [Verrucomicrobiales bacterium]|nr:PPC domain-containing protein [Verrucomicrobiales bacterium]
MKSRSFPRSRLFLSAALMAASAGTVLAAYPEFGGIFPRGGQRGTDVDVTFSGARLADAEEIVSYNPAGIKAASFKVENPNTIKVKLHIEPNCQLGEQIFRIRTKSGLSYARNFFVDQFPPVEEKEPNTLLEQAQPITSGVTITGVARNEDTDYYKIECKKGERLSVECDGIRLGGAFWDPYVAILNSKKFELATCDDSPLAIQDPHASIVVPEDGTYIIEVRDSSYAGRDDAHYRVHVGSFPRPTVVYPAGGKAGSEVNVTYLGDVGGPIQQKVAVPNTPGEVLPLFAQANNLSAPSPNFFRITSYDNYLEAEPNNSHAEAKAKQTAPLAAPVALNGIIEKPGDEDWLKFTAKKGERFDIIVHARDIRSPLDPVLEVFNKDGGGMGGNDDNGANPDSKIGGWSSPADGEYYVRVRDHLARGGPDFIYRVEVAPAERGLNAYIARYDRTDSQMWTAFSIPQGSRHAIQVHVDRIGVGGDTAWECPNLPAGVKLESEPIPGNSAEHIMILSAAADAPLAAGLLKMTPKPADPKQGTVPGRWMNNIEFVQGEPNSTPYVISKQTLFPVAVVEPIPFTMELVPPAVPLVQSGTIDLKVKVTRKEGFKAPITVRMLWNPPGISAPGTVGIPEGKDEVIYQLTANGDAPANTWKICMRGESDAGAGPIYTSSALTPITIAPPYVKMKMEMASTEQGKPTELFCKLDVAKKWEGKAKVVVYGLPAKTSTVEKEISAEDKEVRFPVTTAPDSPTGKHQNLFCQAIIMEKGVPIPHTIGQGGVIRIDPPPPAPPPAAVAKNDAPAAPKPAAPPAAKPLSRLEQLRQQQAAGK